MKKNDFILILVVLLVAFSGFLATSGGPADTVRVTFDGKLFCENPLSEDCEIDIGGTNTAVIKNSEVYMKSATCPDKLCIHQGKITDSSKKIVCLPNKVVIEVTKKSEIDMVVK